MPAYILRKLFGYHRCRTKATRFTPSQQIMTQQYRSVKATWWRASAVQMIRRLHLVALILHDQECKANRGTVLIPITNASVVPGPHEAICKPIDSASLSGTSASGGPWAYVAPPPFSQLGRTMTCRVFSCSLHELRSVCTVHVLHQRQVVQFLSFHISIPTSVTSYLHLLEARIPPLVASRLPRFDHIERSLWAKISPCSISWPTSSREYCCTSLFQAQF